MSCLGPLYQDGLASFVFSPITVIFRKLLHFLFLFSLAEDLIVTSQHLHDPPPPESPDVKIC